MHTRFFSSRGTPNTLVVSESLLVEGDIENLIMSPKLITCKNHQGSIVLSKGAPKSRANNYLFQYLACSALTCLRTRVLCLLCKFQQKHWYLHSSNKLGLLETRHVSIITISKNMQNNFHFQSHPRKHENARRTIMHHFYTDTSNFYLS